MMNPAGRVAVVTGANQGIGFYIALQLGLSGKFAHVILACRSATKGQEAIQAIQEDLTSHSSSTSLSCESLVLGDSNSHTSFAKKIEENFGKVDVLVNNAGMAYKGADPTPFEQQCQPTLDVNFRGTVDFNEKLLPLIRKGSDPRIVNLSSMAGRLSQVSPELQQKFTSPDLTIPELMGLMNQFQSDVLKGTHRENGWSSTNYGMSKFAVTAATKVWARENPGIAINCCCPGYCSTSMSSYGGSRLPAEGAKNAVIPATMDNPPTGAYFADFKLAEW
jgi:carbonyl reductase 1